MKLANEFDVHAPIDDAWTLLLDVERVAACLPGASVEGNSDDAYAGRIKVKLGPMTVNYAGTLRLTEVDSDEHTAVMEVKAKELKGQGTAAARIHNHLQTPEEGVTRVRVETDLTVTGRPAQLGRGIMQEVAANMLRDFGRNLERELDSDGRNDVPSAERSITAEATDRGPDLRSQPDTLDIGRALAGPVARRLRVAAAVALLLAALLRARRRRTRR